MTGSINTAYRTQTSEAIRLPNLHGLFLKHAGIFTTKDPKSTKFNIFVSFGHPQRPIMGIFVVEAAKVALQEKTMTAPRK